MNAGSGKGLGICAAVVLSAAAQAAENPLANAQNALASGAFDEAYQLFLPYAENGDGLAQFSVGLILHNQWIGSRAGQLSACQWFLDAANNGIPMAQQMVGDCFAEGAQLERNLDKAVEWYERAAQSGLYSASCRAGKLYLSGDVSGKTTAQAIQLCIESANRGGKAAALSLGQWFMDGVHVDADPVQTIEFLLPFAPSDQEAAYLLGKAYEQADRYPDNLRLARLWYETAASQGYLPAYLPTARLYFADQSSDDTEAKAYLWIKATLARSSDPSATTRANAMLKVLLARIPSPWPKQLDPTLEAHLNSVTE